MEYINPLSYSYSSRMESQYNDINDNINKLIEDLGLKVQKQLVAIEERALLNYKEDLLQTQNRFKDLKETRNDEAIKQNILNMKIEQEKVYQQSTEKSLEMNRIYDKLKVQFKQAVEYSHQLELQLAFLAKQCKIAKAKSQALDQEIAQYEKPRRKDTVKPLQKTQSYKQFSREHSKTQENVVNTFDKTMYERRLSEKIQQLKEFLSYIKDEETPLQRIFSKYDFESLKTEREKAAYFQKVFTDKEFKSYIYKILFSKRDKLMGKTIVK